MGVNSCTLIFSCIHMMEIKSEMDGAYGYVKAVR